MNYRTRVALSLCLFLSFALLSGDARAQQLPTRSTEHLWPSYRHDNSLSAFSPLKGGLGERPKVCWSIDLGAARTTAEQWRFADFDGDGTNDYLRILSDRLICESLAGERLWQSANLPQPVVIQTADFAGHGRMGILVRTETGTRTSFHMIDGRTGEAATLYAMRNVFGNALRVGNLLPGVPGQQLCAWWSGERERPGQAPAGHGYLWSFEHGLTDPRLRFEAHPTGTVYAPLHLFADMDGDLRADMVMVSHENIWCWDIESGEMKYHHCWGPEIRTYWAQTAALPLKPGELPSLLMINPMLPGVQVVTQNGKAAFVKWKRIVGEREDQYQTKVVIGPGAPDPFIDLDRDGTIEIMASVRNEHGDGRPSLVIFNADTGERLLDAPHTQVIAVDDLDGDQIPEVVLAEPELLRIANWKGTEFVSRWKSVDVTPLLAPTRPGADLQRAVGARTTGPNRTIWRDTPGSSRFLLRFGGSAADTVWACELNRNDGFRRLREVSIHAALGNEPDRKGPRGTYGVEGDRIVFSVDGRAVRSVEIRTKRTFLPPPPLVGTLGGETRVVARNHAGTLVSYSGDGGQPRALIPQAQGPTEPLHLSMDAIGVVCDVDHDGINELVAGTQDGGLSVVAVDAAGRVKRRWPANADASQWVLAGVGRLGAGQGCSVIVRHKTGNNSWASPWIVEAYAGRTGQRLWQRSWYGRYGSDASRVKFALHVPTALHDYNGDGADDLLVNSENFYGIIDISTGKDLVAPAEGTSPRPSGSNPQLCFSNRIPGHWTAYATPMVVDLFGRDQAPLVLMSRAFALTSVIDLEGHPHWHYGLTRDTTARRHAGIADLDGDGQREIVTSQVDGLLRAFNATPSDTTCPLCASTQQLNADTRAGHVRWEYQLVGPVSDFASADLDGDERDELLVGSSDGSLWALQEHEGRCRVLWEHRFESPVGSPVVADLDGDRVGEILVPVADGHLHCLKGQNLQFRDAAGSAPTEAQRVGNCGTSLPR